jgi:hypothetical protein
MPTITGNEIAWSSNYCIFLNNTELDPAALRLYNWLHDWGEGYEDIYEGKERLTSDAGR